MAKSKSLGRQKGPSLGEELRAVSEAAKKQQEEAQAAAEKADAEARAKRRVALPAEARSYFKTTLLPKLRAQAEKGEEFCREEFTPSEADFVDALLQVLREKGLGASSGLEDCEDPNTEIPTKYKAYVITIRIR